MLRLSFNLLKTDEEFVKIYSASEDMRRIVEDLRPQVVTYIASRKISSPGSVAAFQLTQESVDSIWHLYTDKEFLHAFGEEGQESKHPKITILNENNEEETVWVNRARRELRLSAVRGLGLHENMMPLQLRESQAVEKFAALQTSEIGSRDKRLHPQRRHRMKTDVIVKQETSRRADAAGTRVKVTKDAAAITDVKPLQTAWQSPSTPARLQPSWRGSSTATSSKAAPAVTSGKLPSKTARKRILKDKESLQLKVAKGRAAVREEKAVAPAAKTKAAPECPPSAKKNPRSHVESALNRDSSEIVKLSNASAEATAQIFPCPETAGEPFNYKELLIGKGDKRKPNGVSRDFYNSCLVTFEYTTA